MAAVLEQAKQLGVRRQHQSRSLGYEVARSLHGAHECIEFRPFGERLRVDSRRLAFAFPAVLLGKFQRFGKNAAFLLVRRRPDLEPFFLPFRAEFHAQAPAFGLHAGVKRRPVLLREVETPQQNVDDFDAEVSQRNLTALAAHLGKNRFRPQDFGLDRNKGNERTSPDCRTKFGKQDVAESRFGSGAVEDGLEELLGVADTPEDCACSDDRRFFERQEFGGRRRIGK